MKLSTQKGFTLLELMIVIAIIGILVAIAVGRLKGNITDANNVAAKAEVDTVATVLGQCALMNCQTSTGTHSTTGQEYIACNMCTDPSKDYTVVHPFPSGVNFSMNPDPMFGMPTYNNPVSFSIYHEYGSQTFCYNAEPAELHTVDGLDPTFCPPPTTYP
jgi:prepilin-type N-terminal cleavage/methylation domain-containing protein